MTTTLESHAESLRPNLISTNPMWSSAHPVGESKEREVDVRIIAATNRDPHAEIRQRRYREDLYYRLAVVTITLPPLRERKIDIPKISSQLLDELYSQFEAEEPGYQHKTLSASANAFVKRHEWPGNVRQLYNVLVQAMVLSDKPSLKRADIAAALGEMPQLGTFVSLSLERSLGDGFNLREHLNDLQASYPQSTSERFVHIRVQQRDGRCEKILKD